MPLGPHLVAFAILVSHVAVRSLVIPEDVDLPLELRYNQDAHLTISELIEKYGYNGETHAVETEDGYVIEMHRITGTKADPNPEGKQPVLLMHGLLSSSIDWIISGPDRALGYLLADEGYDVWLGNTRGNTFSRKHNRYTTRDKEFWQFSWHESGCTDLPAMIDYILAKSIYEKLIYVGHSQGTTDFWVMASERSEYQDKIKAMFALAPVAYLTHIQSPLYRALSLFSDSVATVMAALGHYEFQPTPEFLKQAMVFACDPEAWTQPICSNVVFLVGGFGSDQLNMTMLPAIIGHIPAGASVRQVVHFAQLTKARAFRQYDHGLWGNWMKYKRFTPPAYDLSKIKVPVSLHYSAEDIFVHPKDVNRLHKQLGNPIGKFRVPHEKFTHLDFLWAYDGKKLLYSKIIGIMKKYED